MKVNEKHEDRCKDNSQKKKYRVFQNYATPDKVRRLDCVKNNLPNDVKNILFFFYELKRQKSRKIHFLRRNFSSRRFIVPPRYRSLSFFFFFSFDHRGTQRVEAGKKWSKGISRGST